MSTTELEAHSNEFFHERTTLQFTEYISDRLWTEIIPQIAQEEPSIRHALYALSSFHENFSDEERLRRDPLRHRQTQQFAIAQYNQAIGNLLGPQSDDEKPPLHVQLLSCLLFITIEVSG
jgi:hypothetical protein